MFDFSLHLGLLSRLPEVATKGPEAVSLLTEVLGMDFI